MSEPTNWPKPGDEAVILQPWDRGSLRAESVVVERVMKRDVVLSNGDRFNVSHLTRQVGGTWGMTLYLVRPDDSRVAVTRERIAANRRRSRAINAFEDWRINKASASEVAAAFNAIAEAEADR